MKTIYHPIYMSLIDKLITARKEKEMTQQQLAETLGKHQSYVAKVEGCERKLDVLELVEWCQVLGKTASQYVQEIEQVTVPVLKTD